VEVDLKARIIVEGGDLRDADGVEITEEQARLVDDWRGDSDWRKEEQFLVMFEMNEDADVSEEIRLSSFGLTNLDGEALSEAELEFLSRLVPSLTESLLEALDPEEDLASDVSDGDDWEDDDWEDYAYDLDDSDD